MSNDYFEGLIVIIHPYFKTFLGCLVFALFNYGRGKKVSSSSLEIVGSSFLIQFSFSIHPFLFSFPHFLIQLLSGAYLCYALPCVQLDALKL